MSVQHSTRPSHLSPSQAYLNACLNRGIANTISIGISFGGYDLSYQPPPELLEQLKATPSEDTVVKDLAIVLLTPGVATDLAGVKVLLRHTKKTISELEGSFEESLRAIAKFDELFSED